MQYKQKIDYFVYPRQIEIQIFDDIIKSRDTDSPVVSVGNENIAAASFIVLYNVDD